MGNNVMSELTTHAISRVVENNMLEAELEAVELVSDINNELSKLESCDTVEKFQYKLDSKFIDDIDGVSVDVRSHIESVKFNGLGDTKTMSIDDVSIDYETPIHFAILNGTGGKFDELVVMDKLIIFKSKSIMNVYSRMNYYFAFGIILNDSFIVLGLRKIRKNILMATFAYTVVDEQIQDVLSSLDGGYLENYIFEYNNGLVLFQRSIPTSYMKLTEICYFNDRYRNVPFSELVNSSVNASFTISQHMDL